MNHRDRLIITRNDVRWYTKMLERAIELDSTWYGDPVLGRQIVKQVKDELERLTLRLDHHLERDEL